MKRPDLTLVPEWYHRYINLVEGADLNKALLEQEKQFREFLEAIPENKRNYRYAPGKWTILELLQHILDAERVFAYRALSFARKDPAPLPGFDENTWAVVSDASSRNWNDAVDEFTNLRKATEYLFSSFDEEKLESTGTASGKEINVRAIGYIIVGHIIHHVTILKERYLNTAHLN